MSVHEFEFIGHLTRDAELSGSGEKSRGNFTIGVNSSRRDSDGNKQEKSFFFRIKAWDALAENAHKYLGQGSHVCVKGRIEPTEYQKDGTTIYGHDFIAEKIEYLATKKPGGAGKSD